MDVFTANSSDLEDTREEYKNELILLHATLKKLDRDMDFSAILNPLLAETGPAMAHVPRLSKQIDRMKKKKMRQRQKRRPKAQHKRLAGPHAQHQHKHRLQLLGSVQPAMGLHLHAAAAAGGAQNHLSELFHRKWNHRMGN